MGTPAHTHSQGSRIYTHTQTHTLTHAHVHVTRSHTPRTCKHPPHTRALTHAHSRSRTPGLSCRPRRRWPRVFPDTHKHMGVQIQTHTPDSRTCLVGLHASTSRGTHVCTHRHTCISLCSKTDGPEDAGPCTPGPGSLASGGGSLPSLGLNNRLCSGTWGWGEGQVPRLNAFGKTPQGRSEGRPCFGGKAPSSCSPALLWAHVATSPRGGQPLNYQPWKCRRGLQGCKCRAPPPPGNPGSRGLGAAMGCPGLRPPRS